MYDNNMHSERIKILMSSGSKKKEPKCICLSKAKASHSQRVCAEDSFSSSHFLHEGLLLSPINPLNPELNPICYLLALLGAHHFLHVSRIRVKLLTFRLLTSCIYGAPILDVSKSHATTQHSR